MVIIHETGCWEGIEEKHRINKTSNNLAKWISNFLIKQKYGLDNPIYDFGCGDGFYLDILSQSGFTNLTGIECFPPINKKYSNIIAHDLTQKIIVTPGIVISIEVGEHIPKKYIESYISNIYNATSKFAIISWAVPKQKGLGHINCLSNIQVINIFQNLNFIYMEKESIEARKSVTDSAKWLQNTIMVFKKESHDL